MVCLRTARTNTHDLRICVWLVPVVVHVMVAFRVVNAIECTRVVVATVAWIVIVSMVIVWIALRIAALIIVPGGRYM